MTWKTERDERARLEAVVRDYRLLVQGLTTDRPDLIVRAIERLARHGEKAENYAKGVS